jgi:hypothetical protein
MPSNKITRLPVKIQSEPVPEVIERLEQLLALAKTGHLRAVGFSYVRQGFRSSYGYVGTKDLQALHALHSGLMTAWTSLGVEIDRDSTEVDPDAPETD